jgi:YD repeat-containing protein
LAVAGDGTTYVADTGNGRIRVIRPDGMVETLVGGGPSLLAGDGYRPAQAALARPYGVALSPDGSTIVVSDYSAQTVWKVVFPGATGKDSFEIPSEDGSMLDVFDADGYHLRTESSTTRRVLWRFTYQSYPSAAPNEPPRRLVTEIHDDFGNVTRIQRAANGAPVSVVAPFGQTTILAVDGAGFLSGISRSVSGRTESVTVTGRPDGLIESIREPNGGIYQYGWDPLGRLASVQNPATGSLTLTSSSETKDGRKVDLHSTMNRTGSMELAYLPKAEVRWTGVDSAGLQATRTERKDGSIAAELPGGLTAELTTVPDRLYAPHVDDWSSLTLSLAPGRSLSLSHSATASEDPADPLRTVQRSDQVSVNGRTSSVRFDGQGRTLTSVSPAGRTAVAHLDERNRVTSADVPGVAEPVQRFYDAHGRLDRVEQGAGAALRRIAYAYDAGSGYLASVTDALGRTTRFEHDEAGHGAI